jgi:hypothetical protein
MTEKTFSGYVALTGWYDPDTFYGVLDQGRGMFHAGGMEIVDGKVVLKTIRHRCAIVQAIEKGVEGEESVVEIVRANWPPMIYECATYKADDNFDRPLVDLIHPVSGLFFSSWMLSNKLGVRYKR